MRTRRATTAFLTAIVISQLAIPAQAATNTWYVQAGAATSSGTKTRPFSSLAQAETASQAGDTIVVLPSTRVLDGGIALKPRQTLRGAGPSVLTEPAPTTLPRLANTTTRLEGDAVRLADDTAVSNLRIAGSRRGAVYGLEVTGTRVSGNNISGQNSACARGFLIPQFNAPTNIPGVGVPIPGGLQNGWAAIMIDASGRHGLTATVTDNVIHHATCGDGIDVRLWGTATGTATISGNTIHHLGQGLSFLSVLAIGLQARDSARLVGRIDGNNQSALGTSDGTKALNDKGTDSEGVFLNAVGPATLDSTVTDNRYTNDQGWGGFSANGLEMVSMGSGSRMSAVVRDSTFTGPPGDVIEHGGLGTDAVMTMTLDHVTAERSVGFGDTRALPFNNGDCVLAGSLGARNVIRLTVRNSALRSCKNNGLAVGSNVVNGSGPTTEISLDVDDSSITDNHGGNLGIRNFTKLDALSVRVQHTDLRRSKNEGTTIADFSAQDLGQTAAAQLDLGGGSLGSTGDNCMTGGLLAAHVMGYAISARHDWWGQPGGPIPGQTLVAPGSLDTADPLATAPEHCP
ncbi:MAG: hypothetical protein ACJ71Z_05275 [Aeromicrobium sp.]